MEFIIIFIPFLLAIVMGNIIIPYIILITYKKRLFDPIDSRKLHKHITPRLGGVAFVPVQCCLFALTVVFVYKVNFIDLHIVTSQVFPMFIMLLCGLVMLFLVGIADDLIGIGYKFKFVVQVLVACFLPLSGLWINDFYGFLWIHAVSPWIGIPLTVFIVVLIVNAINLVDGLNGLCSGIVGVASLVLGILFMYYQAWIHALFAFITLGVLLSFFYFNVFGASKKRRRIFMGDTGSMTLGYSVAFLAVSFAMNNASLKPYSEGAIMVAASVLIVPVFDVLRVMIVRFMAGESLFKADRNHLHHKLLRSGFTHTGSMLMLLGLSLFFCIINIVMVRYFSVSIVVLIDFSLWIILTVIFNQAVKQRIKDLNGH